MKKLITVIYILCLGLILVSCGNVSKEQKGWDEYCKIGASQINVSFEEYQELAEENLTLNYVYLEGTDTIYYEGYYGMDQTAETSFYFMYMVDEDYVVMSKAEASYEHALELYHDGEKGEIGKLKFK